MLLFELAISLDMRSGDLVDAAREAGLGDLQAGSDLDAAQVAALRARFGGGVPTAPSGMPPVGPATWGAPAPSPDGTGPQAPAHWGPPPGADAGPSSWSPPPGEPAAVPADAPSAGPVPSSASGSGSGFSRGQVAAIGVAVALAVGLFAFMAVNTGGGGSPGTAAEAELDSPAPAGHPRDADAYCRGVRQVSPFLLELGRYAASTSTTQFDDLKALVGREQEQVASGMDLIVANGPAASSEAASVLADGLDEIFAAVLASSTEAEFQATLRNAGPDSFASELDQLLPEWRAACS